MLRAPMAEGHSWALARWMRCSGRPETQDLFDDSKDRFDGALSLLARLSAAIQRLSLKVPSPIPQPDRSEYFCIVSPWATKYHTVQPQVNSCGFKRNRLLISLTAVGLFETAGAVLTSALFIVPASVSYLLSKKFQAYLFISVVVRLFSGLSGFALAYFSHTVPSAAVALSAGVIFFLVLVFVLEQGLLAQSISSKKRKLYTQLHLLLLHLSHHEGTVQENVECCLEELPFHLGWDQIRVTETVLLGLQRRFISENGLLLKMTPTGKNELNDFIRGFT